MKTVCAVASMLLLVACGSSSSDAPPPPNGDSTPSDGTDLPPRAPEVVPGTPVDSELTETYGVFVVPGANGIGTRESPFGSIQAAIDAGKRVGKRVYVCSGTYKEAIVLADGVPVVGGLDCRAVEWKSGAVRSRIEAPSSPAMRASDITSATRFAGFEVIAPDATTPSGSSYTLVAKNAAALTVADARLVAGRAASGAAGTEPNGLSPAIASAGPGGAVSLYPCPKGGCVLSYYPPLPGAAGATVVCNGAAGHDPETGGHGGTGGIWRWDSVSAMWIWFSGDARSDAQPGEQRTGARGASGSDGASASAMGPFTTDGYVAANGTAGTDGKPGFGGSGGNGVAPLPQQGAATNTLSGNAGSGGGAGGCPGLAGTPGGGGGASIGALLFESPVTFDASEIVASDGGAGGAGTFGSAALGGTPGAVSQSGRAGTDGHPGGAGGASGASGSGAGGPSIGVAHTGGAPRLTGTTVKHGAGGAGAAWKQRVDQQTRDVKTVAASAAGVSTDVYAIPQGG